MNRVQLIIPMLTMAGIALFAIMCAIDSDKSKRPKSGAKIIYVHREIVTVWNKLSYYDVSVIGYIYLVKRKFLWRKLKPYLYTKVSVPYVEDPIFDGEYASNKLLRQSEIQMRATLELQMDKIKRKINGIHRV